MVFKKIEPSFSLPQMEEEIGKFWEKDNTFKKSIENRKDAELYSFYDGPPFATGTPHYGHIVASTMKDVVPRFWTMKGYRVDRVWGWDCHGLPIENIAEQELGIKHKKEIEDLGVEKFNQICRSKVLGYVSEWEKVIKRLGRWVDMENAYVTMDPKYMESVWWVFKELYDKGLIYEGYRSMHICPRCETTLSQSEVSEGYKTIKDLSVIAKFAMPEETDTYILAWTTTPWTLLANVALAVGLDIDYVKVSTENIDTGQVENYILAKAKVSDVLKDRKYEIIEEFKGSDLLGKKYESLFNDYAKLEIENNENGWKIYDAPFVTTEEGTGIVHIAPAFGEDDMTLGKEKNLPFVQHIGMDGIIKKEVEKFAGLHVKDPSDTQKTDVEIIKDLASRDLLFFKEKYEHSYPHCWRCETPLLNYATSSYFVSITKVKEKALELAKEINWSPSHIKEGRFGKWLEGARDWSISRQRYWASVIPIWKCECGEVVVLGSIKELEELSGQKVEDLHKDTVDNITFPCKKCDGQMKRIPDVLDTWFDSGSMPYAQLHYPFENKDNFENIYPADFIGEGQDQTRAWFYYLHILATSIKENIAFKNVVVNGIVLAEDGKKMSKRLKNYPDPKEVIDKYGADALRMYLLISPVMQAENLNFTEKDLAELSRGFFRMLWNSYSFFTLYSNIDNWVPVESPKKSDNILDQWILSELNSLIKDVNSAMEKYELTKAARFFLPFVDNLSNWFIRRSRKRFQKQGDLEDKNNAYQTLYICLVELSKTLAPFAPFISEEIYKNLTSRQSVHLENFPKFDEGLIDNNLNSEMQKARKIVELGLKLRSAEKIKVRQPLKSLSYSGAKLESELENIIADEVNVKEIINNISDETGYPIVNLDLNITDDLKEEGIKNDIQRQIQDLRKKAGFSPDDKIAVYFQADEEISKIINHFQEQLKTETNLTDLIAEKPEGLIESEVLIDSKNLWLGVKSPEQS